MPLSQCNEAGGFLAKPFAPRVKNEVDPLLRSAGVVPGSKYCRIDVNGEHREVEESGGGRSEVG